MKKSYIICGNLCRCSGYVSTTQSNKNFMEMKIQAEIVNKSIKIDSIGIITGRPLYTDDLVINNNSLVVSF